MRKQALYQLTLPIYYNLSRHLTVKVYGCNCKKVENSCGTQVKMQKLQLVFIERIWVGFVFIIITLCYNNNVSYLF